MTKKKPHPAEAGQGRCKDSEKLRTIRPAAGAASHCVEAVGAVQWREATLDTVMRERRRQLKV